MGNDDEIKIKIEDSEDSKKRIKKMEEELEKVTSERDDMENKLTLIAEQEFQKKRQEAGAPESIDSPEKLMGFVAGKGKSSEGGSAGVIPLSQATIQDDKPQSTKALIKSDMNVNDMSFDSTNQMIEVLDVKARKGDKSAKEALFRLRKKGYKVSGEVELDWKSTSDVVSGKEKVQPRIIKKGED